jgi:hypothetical membrane protein
MIVNENKSLANRKLALSRLAMISALIGLLCSGFFWVLVGLHNFIKTPLWLSSQLTWQVTLLVAVILAIIAKVLRAKFGFPALVISLATFLLVMYGAGV